MSPSSSPAERFAALFGATALAGVYQLPPGPVDELLAGAAAAGCLVMRVDLAAAGSKDDMLDAIARSLRFPEWFGHNWDALNDCLLDMGWLPALGYVIIFEHCDVLRRRAESQLFTLLETLQDVANDWRERGTPFWALVGKPADAIASLPVIRPPE